MEAYGPFVYFGGGGGYEIKNKIVGYRIEADSEFLTKIVHEESTGDGVANFMMMAKDNSNILVALVDHSVHFYTADNKTGKLEQVHSFQADFADENPSLNHAALSNDNMLLATGGDDKIARVYQLSKDFKR